MYIGTVDFTPTPINVIFETLTNQKKNPAFRLDNEEELRVRGFWDTLSRTLVIIPRL